MTRLLSFLLILFPALLLGADVVGAVNQGTSWLNGTFVVIAAPIGIAIEALLRFIPSSKPLSICLFVSSLVHAVAGFFDALAAALDKLLPQNLK